MPGSEGDPNNPDKNKWNFDNVRDLFETMKGFAKPLKNFSSGATSSGGTPLSLKQQTKKQGLDVAKRIKEFLGGKGIGVPTRVPGQSFAGASGKVPGMTSGLGMSGSFTTRPSSSISSSSSARGRVSSGSVRAAEASTPLRPTAPDIVDPNKALGKEFRRVIVTELIAKYTNFLETFGEEFYDSKGQSWMSGPIGQPRKKFKKKENFADLKKGKTAQEIAELERLEKPNARFMPFIMGSKNEPRDVNPHYKSGGMYQKGGVNDVGATHHYSMGQSVETTLRKIETFRFMLKQELLLLKGLVDELGNLTPKGEAKVLEIQRKVGPKGNPGHPGASGSLGTTSTTTTTSTVFPRPGDGSGKPTEIITAVAGEKIATDFRLAITASLESLIAAEFKKQQGKAEEFETTGGEETGAAAQDIMGVNRKDTQAGQFSKSDVKRTGDDIDALIRQAQSGAQASVDAGLEGVKVNQDRVNVLKHISEFEQGRSTLDKESLKNLVDRYTATANFNIATKASLENQRRFTADLVTRTELQVVAQDKLNKSYHDGEKFADALGDAIGSRFQYNATTAREQFGQLTLGMVDDFKGGTKEAFGAAIRGTATLREAFAKVFDTIVDNMLDHSLEMGVDAVFGAIGSGLGAGGKARGGRIRGYNSGGFVDQGSGVRDDVPAMMQGGEYVIRKSSVDKYGRGLFESLNSGGVVGYARGDRVMKNRARSEFLYNDPKKPTAGSWNTDSRLSAFATMESGSPMIAIQKEREKTLEQYIKDKAAYDAMVQKAKDNFKKQQKARMKKTLISVGLQAATMGLMQYQGSQGASDMTGSSGPYAQATTGNPTSFDDFQFATPKAAMPSNPWEGKTIGAQVRGGHYGFANGGFIKGFAQGGRNRDNIPAMLMGGEYVVNKQSVDKYGVGLFNGLNNGTARGFAEGGPVGESTGGGGAPTTANNNFEINVNISGNGDAETTSSSDQNQEQSTDDQDRNEQLGEAVKGAVQTEIIEQQRPGGLLYREDRF